MDKRYVGRFVISISLCLGAGFLGSVFTRPEIPTWYAGIAKPSFTPPPWVFGPVWTTLYLMMGVSLFLVWRKGLDYQGVRTAAALFMIQLFFNTLWSYLFFTLHSPLAGLLDIMLLWVTILFTIIAFLRVSRVAGFLLLPYIAWVTFALVLNISIWILNR